MTSSNGDIFHVTGLLCGEFTGPGEFHTQRPVTRGFDVFFDLCLSKQLSKRSRRWWFETPLCPLWRHCNETMKHACRFVVVCFVMVTLSGIILGMGSANGRRHYVVTSSLIGWAQIQTMCIFNGISCATLVEITPKKIFQTQLVKQAKI